MPIEYEMKYLYDIVSRAIYRYSEDHTCAKWFHGIENIILQNFNENNVYYTEYFDKHELASMKELIRRGLWVKWSDKHEKPVLSPDPLNNIFLWDDSKPIKNGSD
jgi:hypothetical protein